MSDRREEHGTGVEIRVRLDISLGCGINCALQVNRYGLASYPG